MIIWERVPAFLAIALPVVAFLVWIGYVVLRWALRKDAIYREWKELSDGL